jgi:hypothetical protein
MGDKSSSDTWYGDQEYNSFSTDHDFRSILNSLNLDSWQQESRTIHAGDSNMNVTINELLDVAVVDDSDRESVDDEESSEEDVSLREDIDQDEVILAGIEVPQTPVVNFNRNCRLLMIIYLTDMQTGMS